MPASFRVWGSFFVFVVHIYRSYGHLYGKECLVSNVGKGQKVYYPLMKDPQFYPSFLRLRSAELPAITQIFIEFFGNNNNNNRRSDSQVVQLLITNERKLVVRNNGKLLATSGGPLQGVATLPSWLTFLVQLDRNQIKIFRLESATSIINTKIPDLDAYNEYEVSISSKHSLFATMNCIAKCKVFSACEDPLTIDLKGSFSINLTSPPKLPNGSFSFELSSSWFDSMNRTIDVISGREEQIVVQLEKPNDNQSLELIVRTQNMTFSPENVRMSEAKTFTLTVFNCRSVLWSLECKPHKELIENDTRYSRRGKALAPNPISSNTNSPTSSVLSLGEVAAWIIAALAVCALIIVGMTLYTKVTQTDWTAGEASRNNPAVSVSHVGAFEMLPFPKPKSSTFYAEIRRPDEGSEVQSNRGSANVISDFLYPLDLSASDEKSLNDDHFPSVRSRDTVITNIPNLDSD